MNKYGTCVITLQCMALDSNIIAAKCEQLRARLLYKEEKAKRARVKRLELREKELRGKKERTREETTEWAAIRMARTREQWYGYRKGLMRRRLFGALFGKLYAVEAVRRGDEVVRIEVTQEAYKIASKGKEYADRYIRTFNKWWLDSGVSNVRDWEDFWASSEYRRDATGDPDAGRNEHAPGDGNRLDAGGLVHSGDSSGPVRSGEGDVSEMGQGGDYQPVRDYSEVPVSGQ